VFRKTKIMKTFFFLKILKKKLFEKKFPKNKKNEEKIKCSVSDLP